MPKKKPEHYVNNKELLEAMIVYRTKVGIAREKFIKKYDKDPPKSGVWEGKPRIPNYLGECFLKIATHLSYRPNFVNYILSTTSINEGETVTVTVNTVGIPDGSTLFYTSYKTIDITPSSGSFIINSDTGSFNITAQEDLLVESAETFTVSIRTVSIAGSIVSTTDAVTIANTTTFALSSSTNLPAEGDTITLTVTTTGVLNGITHFKI